MIVASWSGVSGFFVAKQTTIPRGVEVNVFSLVLVEAGETHSTVWFQ